MNKMKPAEVKCFSADGGFVAELQKLIRETVIPYQYDVMCDKLPDTEKSHVIDNFVAAAATLRGEDVADGFYGMVFQDSDAAKWLEAVAYTLAHKRDSELEKTADSLIDLIAASQDSDGYLNTFFTVKDKEKRWTNILEGHELYCSGHMIEAACAYYEATGKRKLLDVMIKNAEHIYDVFINGGHEGYPGHSEIELALMKLYRTTGDERFAELSKHFIDIRGVDPHYYEKERSKREWTVWNGDGRNHHYQQSHAPVREQKDAVGHSVRALYLYTAMADIASHTDDAELLDACRNLWNSITRKRMYITGGVGSTVHGEAFTEDYDLPGDTAYAETCASVALMMFASAMLRSEAKGEYADIMEKAFYNTVLAGMQADGKRFFYVNPLEVIPGISGRAVTHRHTLTQRPGWYTCACCPPNVARLVSSIGSYAYGESDSTAYCHLYAQGTVKFRNGIELVCETDYPYDFTVKYTVKKGGRLAIRIPAYSEKYSLTVNSQAFIGTAQKGYLYLDTKDGDKLLLTLDGSVRFIYPNTKIPALSGLVSLARGPLVYCFEGRDNEDDILSLKINTRGNKETASFSDGLIKNSVKITLDAFRVTCGDSLYSEKEPGLTPCKAVAIPYYLWGNRGENQMRVFMPCI